MNATSERWFAGHADIALRLEIGPPTVAFAQSVAQVVLAGWTSTACTRAFPVGRRVKPVDLDVADRAEARPALAAHRPTLLRAYALSAESRLPQKGVVGRTLRSMPRSSRSAWTTRAFNTTSRSRVIVRAIQSMYVGSMSATSPR